MVEKIIWYLLYLIAFGLYFYAAGIWLKHFNSRLLGTGSFTLINQLGALLGLMPLVLFPWLLTGFFHLDFLFLVFLIAEGTIFLSMVIGFIFQTPTRSIGLRSFIVGTELATTYPKAATIFLHVPRYVFAAIILATSWVYFSHEFHSVEVQKPILLITISLILFQICYQLFNVSLIIFSAGIPDRTRRALFINILVTSIPIGIYLTLLLSFAGLESYYSFIAIPGLVPDILSVPTLILSGFYFLALVVPYLIGSE